MLSQAKEAPLVRSATNTVADCKRYFDVDYARSTNRNLLLPLAQIYFRARFVGFDELPASENGKPLILISNHSGMAFSWDSIVFTATLAERDGYRFREAAHVLAEPLLNQNRLMAPYLIDEFWSRSGAIDATYRNFDAMLQDGGGNVMIYPEGNEGLSKGFNRRYRLQEFSNTFLVMALRHGSEIATFYTINAEYNNPNSYRWRFINRLANKVGIPFVPMGLSTILLLLQPWLFYFSFPSRLTYVMGERIRPSEITAKDPRLLTRRELDELATQIRKRMQKGLDEAVAQYGKSPYELGGLLRAWLKNWRLALTFLPVFWPFLFSEHDRMFRKRGAELRMEPGMTLVVTSFFRNLDKLIFFLPIVGWIPILLLGLRKQQLNVRNSKR